MKRIKWKKVYKYVRDPKNKPVLFFGFYLLFFIFIAVLVRLSPVKDTRPNKDTDARGNHYYNLGKLDDTNYHFKYEYNIDSVLTSFEGERNGLRELFVRKYNNSLDNFYGYRKLYMQQLNGVWQKSDSPYLYDELFDVDVIREILENATFMSKTEYQNKSHSYTYQISTTTLEKILYNNIVDLDDIPNDVVVTMDNNYYVEEIEYKLDSFANFKNPTNKSLSLKLSYSDFGNIKEIEEPKV